MKKEIFNDSGNADDGIDDVDDGKKHMNSSNNNNKRWKKDNDNENYGNKVSSALISTKGRRSKDGDSDSEKEIHPIDMERMIDDQLYAMQQIRRKVEKNTKWELPARYLPTLELEYCRKHPSVLRDFRHRCGFPDICQMEHLRVVAFRRELPGLNEYDYHCHIEGMCPHEKPMHVCDLQEGMCPHFHASSATGNKGLTIQRFYAPENTKKLHHIYACVKTGNIHACGDHCNQTNTHVPRVGQRVCPLTNLILGDVMVHDKEDWHRGMRPNYVAQGLLEDADNGQASGYDCDNEFNNDQDHEYEQEEDAQHEEEELHKHMLTYQQEQKAHRRQQLDNASSASSAQIGGMHLLGYGSGSTERGENNMQLQVVQQQQHQGILTKFRDMQMPLPSKSNTQNRWHDGMNGSRQLEQVLNNIDYESIVTDIYMQLIYSPMRQKAELAKIEEAHFQAVHNATNIIKKQWKRATKLGKIETEMKTQESSDQNDYELKIQMQQAIPETSQYRGVGHTWSTIVWLNSYPTSLYFQNIGVLPEMHEKAEKMVAALALKEGFRPWDQLHSVRRHHELLQELVESYKRISSFGKESHRESTRTMRNIRDIETFQRSCSVVAAVVKKIWMNLMLYKDKYKIASTVHQFNSTIVPLLYLMKEGVKLRCVVTERDVCLVPRIHLSQFLPMENRVSDYPKMAQYLILPKFIRNIQNDIILLYSEIAKHCKDIHPLEVTLPQ